MKTKTTVLGCLAIAVVGAAFWLTGINARAEGKKPTSYPLTTCIVSGEKLGEMGSPHVFTYQDREIKLCCKSCLKKFNQDQAGYLKKLDAASTTTPRSDAKGVSSTSCCSPRPDEAAKK
ncbi:MAG: hypothetical protein ACTHLW_01750 [Verrucomicrobiota bacterium]